MAKKLLVLSAEKRWEEDTYHGGCQPGTGSAYMLDQKAQLFDNLDQLAELYGFSKDKSQWSINDANAPVMFIGYNRMEPVDGIRTEATEAELALWKEGKLKLWLVDYDFHVVLIEEYETTSAALALFTGVEVVRGLAPRPVA